MSVQTVFENADLRGMILNIRTSETRKDYIKRIYPEWTINTDYNIREITTLTHGITHVPETRSTTWTIMNRDGKIDDAPLIITDNVVENDKIVYYDSIVNLAHIQIKSKRWYIPKYDRDLYTIWDLRDFYNNSCQFTDMLYTKRDEILVLELNFRKSVIKKVQQN